MHGHSVTRHGALTPRRETEREQHGEVAAELPSYRQWVKFGPGYSDAVEDPMPWTAAAPSMQSIAWGLDAERAAQVHAAAQIKAALIVAVAIVLAGLVIAAAIVVAA
ncbi:MAG: hypothetical protein WA944_19120 [Mycobacterium sp.]